MQSLISAASGLIGALIGFGGSLLVAVRAGRVARDQVRYARAHERRDEALGVLYGMLNDLSSAFARWVETPSDPERSPERLRRVNDLIQEVNHHYSRTAVWIPHSFIGEIPPLLHGYMDWEEKALKTRPSERAYDKVREEAGQWLRQEALSREVEIESKIRRALGVEE